MIMMISQYVHFMMVAVSLHRMWRNEGNSWRPHSTMSILSGSGSGQAVFAARLRNWAAVFELLVGWFNLPICERSSNDRVILKI